MDIEQTYMRRLAQQQYPGDVDAMAQGEQQGLEQAAMQATVGTLPQPAMPEDGQGSIREIPRNVFQQALGKFGEALTAAGVQLDKVGIDIPALGRVTLKDLTIGESGKVVEDISYGFMPTRGAGGIGGTAGLKPEALELLNLPVVASAAKVAGKGAIAAGKAGAKFVAPKVGEMLDQYMRRTGMTMDLMAYHGSPARFEAFDASKIGTGEGAQSFGYGLYFSGSPDTAKYYSKTLGDWDFEYASPEARQQLKSATDYADGAWSGLRSALTYADGDKNKAAGILSSQYQSGVKDEEMRSAYRLMAQMLRDGRLLPAHTGRFYTVDIPDEMIGKMIDWDKPIGRQSKQVKEAIQQTRSMLPQNAIDDLGGDLSLLYGPNVTVNQFLNTWESLTGKTGSGEAALRQFGVPGVKYLDEGSRQKGSGTRNFVVFPGGEDQIKILKVE